MTAPTFGILQGRLRDALGVASRLNLFKDVQVAVEAPRDDAEAADGNVRLTLNVKERRMRMRAGTQLKPAGMFQSTAGSNSIGMNVSGQFFNIGGRGEQLDLEASMGSQSTTPFMATLRKPLPWDPSRSVGLSVGSTINDHPPSGWKDNLTGIWLFYQQQQQQDLSSHEVRLGMDWRKIYGFG